MKKYLFALLLATALTACGGGCDVPAEEEDHPLPPPVPLPRMAPEGT